MKNSYVLLCALLLLSNISWAAGNFTNAPGAQAIAMSGGGRTLLDDESAVFGHAAALAAIPSQWVVGWQRTPEYNESGDLEINGSALFVGGHSRMKRNFRGDLSIGLYYYNAYNIHYEIADPASVNTTYGTVEQKFHIVALPYSAEFMNRKLKVGATFQYYSISFSDTSLMRRDAVNVPSALTFNDDVRSGLSMAFSVDYRWQPNASPFELSVASTVNFGHLGEGTFSFDDSTLASLLLDKPAGVSLSTGIHFDRPTYQLSFAVDYDYEDWQAHRRIESGVISSKLAIPYGGQFSMAGLFSVGRSEVGGDWDAIALGDTGYWSLGVMVSQLSAWDIQVTYQRINQTRSGNESEFVGRYAFSYQRRF